MERAKTIVIGTLDHQIFANLNTHLASAAYEVRLVQRGLRILSEILDHEVDLLILDLDLAGVIGIEILPLIRRLRPRLPIILITDDLNLRIRKMAAELGVSYQAYKPVTPSETEAIITAAERLIERSSSFSCQAVMN